MNILFNQGTPAPLRNFLEQHTVSTAYELGWSTLENGELLAQAESHEFEVFVTTDRNLQYQQNLTTRIIAIVVLSTTSWPRIMSVSERVVEIVSGLSAGSFVEIDIP